MGRATPEFVAWGIQSGQIHSGIADIARHQVDVKELERTGASTLSLFKVSVDGQPQFVVKEPGTFYEFEFEHQLTVVRHAAGEHASSVVASPTMSLETKAQAANGNPRFTAESLRKMINDYRGDSAALT